MGFKETPEHLHSHLTALTHFNSTFHFILMLSNIQQNVPIIKKSIP